MTRRRFLPRGPAALDPRAFGAFLLVDAPTRDVRVVDGVAELAVVGPLEAHAGGWCDSYEAIVRDVRTAIASEARTIVLDFDSPGGEVAGMLEACASLRELAERSGARLVAYVSGSACSAAYALACACDEIVVSPAAILGSIGVIDALVDETKMDAAMGVAWSLITSGARKADGAPHAPVTPQAIAARQGLIDDLARVFAEHVSTRRPIGDAAAVLRLEAGVFVGEQAVAVALADRVARREAFVASLKHVTTAAPAAEGMQMDEEVMNALRAAADGDDEEMARRARAALAALEGDEPPPADDPPSSETPPPPTDPDATVASSALAAVNGLAREVQQLRAREEQRERAALYASRTDIAPETRRWLDSLSVEDARKALAHIPAQPSRQEQLAATTQVPATRGNSQASVTPARQELRAEVARRMGGAPKKRGVKVEGSKILINVPVADGGAS